MSLPVAISLLFLLLIQISCKFIVCGVVCIFIFVKPFLWYGRQLKGIVYVRIMKRVWKASKVFSRQYCVPLKKQEQNQPTKPTTFYMELAQEK